MDKNKLFNLEEKLYKLNEDSSFLKKTLLDKMEFTNKKMAQILIEKQKILKELELINGNPNQTS